MKLSLLYANDPQLFPQIVFNESLNVIFAQVTNPVDLNRDSHNLGKTFLISVIDFALLGDIDKNHPFRTVKEFSDLVFFLCIRTNSGNFVTVKRPVTAKKNVAIHIDRVEVQDLSGLPDLDWTESNLSLDRARARLNGLLGLTAIEPYSYRKGLGYSLRRQGDYDDIFRIASRFGRAADNEWKPYLSLVLGLDHQLITAKYELDSDIEMLSGEVSRLQQRAGKSSREYDEIKGRIQLHQEAKSKLQRDVDQFSFKEIESQINRTTIVDMESQVSDLNRERYEIDFELSEIDKSLKEGTNTDFASLHRLFKEAGIAFSEQVQRSYEELEEFNKKILHGRIHRLRKNRESLLERREDVDNLLIKLDEQRSRAMAILKEKETIKKYRKLQDNLVSAEREILDLQSRLTDLDQVARLRRQIEEAQSRRTELIHRIESSVFAENPQYESIRSVFSKLVEAVIATQALIYTEVNEKGNLDFRVRTLDRSVADLETSEGLGNTYKKLLCACFDLAVLQAHSSVPFYRFVYHDGILEGLDNRKKVSLLSLIRDICGTAGVQYILTVIDSDLPRDASDQKLLFDQAEVVRWLHDAGPDGRLFKMRAF